MSRRLSKRHVAVAGLAIALAAVFGPITPAGATQPTEAYIRGAHFSPDTAAVDVYLTAFSGGASTLWLSSVTYGDVSGYKPITPGVYAVSMRPHGAAASTPAVLTWTVNISPGSAYTAAAVGTNNQLRGIVLQDSVSPPPPHTGMVRIIQASSQAGHVSVQAQNGPTLTSDIAYGSASNYVDVPSGAWTIVTHSTTQPNLSAQSSVSVASGTLSSIVVLDQVGGGLTMRTVLDASGAGTVPTGSVSAGGGGTAPRAGSDMDATLSWVAVGAALLLAMFGLIRRRSVRSLRS